MYYRNLSESLAILQCLKIYFLFYQATSYKDNNSITYVIETELVWSMQ